MKRFTGNCPKCKGEDVEIYRYENLVDGVAVSYVCENCGEDFDVVFTDGKIMEGTK